MATVETGCKGTCGISIPRNGPLSPVETCLRMLEEAKAGHSSTRYVAFALFLAYGSFFLFYSSSPHTSYHFPHRGIVKLMPLERISFGGDLEAIKVQVRDLLHDKGLLLKDQEQEEAADAKGAAAVAAAAAAAAPGAKEGEGTVEAKKPTVRSDGKQNIAIYIYIYIYIYVFTNAQCNVIISSFHLPLVHGQFVPTQLRRPHP